MKSKKHQTSQLLDTKELACLMSLSKRQVHRLNSAGKIPKPLKIGGSIRWSSGEIMAWIEADCPDRKVWEQINRNIGFGMGEQK